VTGKEWEILCFLEPVKKQQKAVILAGFRFPVRERRKVMQSLNRVMPMITLRDLVVFPGTLISVDVKREGTVAAVERAMRGDQLVYLVTQKDPLLEEPTIDDLYPVGTIAYIRQIIRLPGKALRVMVEGAARGQIVELLQSVPCLEGSIDEIEETETMDFSEQEIQAMARELRRLLEQYVAVTGRKISISKWNKKQGISRFMDDIISDIYLQTAEKAELLALPDVRKRFERFSVLMQQEIEIGVFVKEFQLKVKEKVDKNQKEYIMREQLKVINEELGEGGMVSDAENYRERAKKLNASDEVKKKIFKEIDRFRSYGQNSTESSVVRIYIETLLELPWDNMSKDNQNIANAKRVLDEDHYGMKKVKERVIEFLAVRTLNGGGDSPIICLVGPPGTGKTSIAKSIARALDKKYVRICLGGVRDEAEIRGHRRTYVAAMPGRIVAGLKQAGVKNPLMLLDEVDKLGNDYKGDPSSALLEVLDGEQNSHFTDHYVEIPVDLSEVLFIATANDASKIPRPLLDRMEIIELSGYTENEKLHIAKEHLVKKQKTKNGLKTSQLSINDKALEKIISSYTREAGVRNLERRISEICRKAALQILEEEKTTVKVNGKNLSDFLGKEKYSHDKKNEKDEVGIVRGLAWTSVGGTTLEIEVNVMPGTGEVKLTGQLGDVMKESAQTGISYVRSIASMYGVSDDYFTKHDIHLHIPEGATPKDGPSAGITMAVGVLSAVTDRKITRDLAMTGEITLRGRVLPIGGLKEKLLAAKAAEISRVLVPAENKKDVEELEEEVTQKIEICFVDSMKEVIRYAFV
jgi:ATP-dependent Lon protease